MAQAANSNCTGTIAPVIHGMIDANAYHSNALTWPLPLKYVQINAEDEKGLVRFTDSKTAEDKLRAVDGVDIGDCTTAETGRHLVKLNSRMYNENKTGSVKDFDELNQTWEEINKLLNGRIRANVKDKRERRKLEDLEEEEKRLKETMNVYIPSLITVQTMDMEFAHAGGYEGEKIYQKDEENGKIFYKRDERKQYLSLDDAMLFHGWNLQISDTVAVAASNPLRFFPLFSYDPRRYRLSGSNDWKKGLLAWDEPFSRVAGSDKKEIPQIWTGFCMNPALGFRPFDELCEHLPKFYEKCEKENIPILANCSPTGIIMHDAKYSKYKRKELLEKNGLSNDTSMYRGTESVVGDIDLNGFYMNHGHPRNWIPVLERYPDLRLCLSGFGGNSEWRQAGWSGEDKDAPPPAREWIRCIIKLAAKYKNVYADISGLNIYDKNIRNGLRAMLDLIQGGHKDFRHLKYKLIFGSGWYHTYLTDVADGGTDVKGWSELRHSYNDYCTEFKNLFYAADKERKGGIWERVSLINAWNFYALSEDKINKIHDELANADDGWGVNRDSLKNMKNVFDGYDDIEGLVKYISRYNEKDPPMKPQKIEDKDLAPLDVETVEPSQIVTDDQIEETYWSYGDDYTRLKNQDDDDVWKTKRYDDLNFHVVTKDGNDGKTVEYTFESVDGQQIDLSGIVSKNKVVFKKVFEEYKSL